MIELNMNCSLTGVPYVTYDVLESYAEAIVADFSMELLECPGIVNVEEFIEFYPYKNQYLAAKEGRIDYSRSQRERTDIESMERQADFLSSAILMPRPALREAYRQFFRIYSDKPRRIIKGRSTTDDRYASILPEFVAELFGVSKRAALIRLEKLTAIVDGRTWRGTLC